jgi:hypothetical protein
VTGISTEHVVADSVTDPPNTAPALSSTSAKVLPG